MTTNGTDKKGMVIRKPVLLHVSLKNKLKMKYQCNEHYKALATNTNSKYLQVLICRPVTR